MNIATFKPGKVEATLNGRNFLVSMLSIIFLMFGYWGADVAPTAADSLIDAIMSGNLTTILFVIITNFINPITKIVAKAKQNGGLDFGFVKSLNFWIQTGTVLLMLLGTIGLVFPENALTEIIGAIQSGDTGLILLALVANIINPFLHFFKDKDKGGTTSAKQARVLKVT